MSVCGAWVVFCFTINLGLQVTPFHAIELTLKREVFFFHRMSLQALNARSWRRVIYQIIFAAVAMVAILFFCSSILLNEQQNLFQQLLSDDNNLAHDNKLALDEDLIKRPLAALSQDDPRLIQEIRTKYLNPPSTLEYNIKGWNNPSLWQANYVKKLLKKKKNGFFIECGAHDGEFLSNTLMFEKVYNWGGLLIEVDPSKYKNLISKHRKAWTVPACLSINNYPSEAMMKKVWNMEGGKATYPFWKITNDPIQQDIEDVIYKVQCFPLYSILLALNRTQIDYLSLDVEGNEMNVFKTIPWDKVNITVVTAEFNHVDQGKDALRQYMESLGYKVYLDGGTLSGPQNIDFIFYHPKLLGNN